VRQWRWSHVSVIFCVRAQNTTETWLQRHCRTTREWLLYDAHARTTRERLLYDVHTYARLENDYCTTCTDIDRYIRARTHAYTDRHTYTNTHTHTHTHTQHTHTHTLNSRNRFLDLSIPWQCVVQQEAVNYVHVDPRSWEAKEVEAASSLLETLIRTSFSQQCQGCTKR
jgi:hypothetical protein